MNSIGSKGSKPIAQAYLGGLSLRPLLLATCFVITSFVLINLCWSLTGRSSTFDIFPMWLIAHAYYDSWQVMETAYQLLQKSQAVSVYQEIFFNLRIKFQYPLTSLLPFYVFEYLGIEPFIYRFNYVNALFQVVGALATGAASALLMRRIYGPLDATLTLAAAVFGTVAFVTFYPTMRAFELGQIQVWINMLFCLAVVFWLLERPFLVGMLIGLICLIKPQFSMFLIWALVRREWGIVAGLVSVVLLGMVVSLYLFGFDNHWDYLSVLQFMSQRGEVFYPNQSINGLLNRFLGNGVSKVFDVNEFPPYNPSVYIGTLLSSLLILSFVLFYKPKNGFIDFLIAGLGFTMASPIAWEHHYGILPIYFVTLFFGILSLPSDMSRRPLLIVLAVAFIVGGNFYAVVNSVGPGFASLVQSYLFFSAVAVFWLLYRLRGRISWDKSTLPACTTATGRLSS